ncbi:MAG: carboxypeptidase regulatory-like domain-containing protein [Planctomycetota bacterium]
MNPRALLVLVLVLVLAGGGYLLLGQQGDRGPVVTGTGDTQGRGDDPAARTDAVDAERNGKDGAPARTDGREAMAEVPDGPDGRRGAAAEVGEAVLTARFVQQGAPMDGLTVRLRDGAGRKVGEVETDADGRVRFADVAAGRHRFAVDDPRVPRGQVLGSCVVPTKGELDLGDIVVEVPARVRGVLRSNKGGVVADASVTLGVEDFSDFLGWGSEPGVRSDAQGRFVIERVLPGRTFLRVDEGGHQRLERELAISPGEDLDLGTITLQVGRALEGLVLDQQNRPVPGARVQPGLELVRGTTRVFGYARARTVTTDDEGRFALGGLGATLRLRVEKDGFRTVEDFEVAPEARFVRIQLSPERGLTGRVLGIPVGEGTRTRVHWAEYRDMAGQEVWAPRDPVACATDGSFRIAEAEDGRFRLFAELEGHGFSKFQDVTMTGRAPRPVELVLEPGGELAVRVTDAAGQPVADVRVRLELDDRPELAPGRRIRLRGEPTVQRNAVSDAEGMVRFGGLFEGKARLVGRHPDYLAAAQGLVLVKGSQQATLVLEQGGFIEGRVLDAQGHPFAGADVAFRALERADPGPEWDDLQGPGRTVSAADGTYRSRALLPGRYEVWLSEDRTIQAGGARVMIGEEEVRQEGLQEATVQAGRVTAVDLSKDPSGALAGTVSFRGLPVEKARVFAWATNTESFHAKETRTDDQGRYHFDDLAPGTWNYCAKPDQGGIPTPVKTVEVKVGVGDTTADIELGGAVLRGRVRMAGGLPLPKELEAVLAQGGGGDRPRRVAIMLTTNNSGDSAKSKMTMRPAPDPEPVRVAADGSFVIERVPAGEWRLSIEGQGQVVFLRRPVTLERDQDLDLGVLELEPLYPVDLKVFDEDGKALNVGTLSAYRKGEPGGSDERVFGGLIQDGHIKIPGLAVGEYRLRFARVFMGGSQPTVPQEADLRVGAGGTTDRTELRLEKR